MSRPQIVYILMMLPGIFWAQEKLFYNAHLYPANDSTKQWFVVNQDDVIVELGKGLPPSRTFDEKIDLNEGYVLPGFVDTQVHLLKAGNHLLRMNLREIKSLDELNQHIATIKPQLKQSMFFGHGLSEQVFDQNDPSAWLDMEFKHLPAVLILKNKTVLFNTEARTVFELDQFTAILGIEKKELDKGTLVNGQAVFSQVLQEKRNASLVEQYAVLRAQNELLKNGITTVSDDTYYPYRFKILRNTQYDGKLQLRVFPKSQGGIVITEKLLPAMSLKKIGLIEKDVDFKKMKNTYAKIPASTLDGLDLKNIHRLITANDNPMLFEVKKEATFGTVLDALESYPLRQKPYNVPIIDYVPQIKKADLDRLTKINVALSMPMYDFLYQKSLSDSTNSYADLFAHSEKIVLSSHWPEHNRILQKNQMASINPFEAMHLLTTGTNLQGLPLANASNVIDRKQFIDAYTYRPAELIVAKDFVGRPKVQVGQLKEGYTADFIVLRQNPLQIASESLAKIEIEATYIDGIKVYDPSGPVIANQNERPKAVRNSDFTVSPAFGYSPTQGFIYGAAYFHWPLDGLASFYNAIVLANTFGGINVVGNYKYISKKEHSMGLQVKYDNFLENFFGDNANTLEIDRGLLERTFFETQVFYDHTLKSNWSAKTSIRYQNYTPEKFKINVENAELEEIEIPFDFAQHEANTILQFELEQNTIDFFNAPKQGGAIVARFSYLPPGFSTLTTNDHLAKLEISGKRFTPFLSEKLILATRLEMGTTLNGNPSYLQRYNLGGSYRLRGFRRNRFRGKHYFMGSVEMRKNVIHQLLDLSAFVDFGNLSETTPLAFDGIKLTYGAGFRVNVLGLSKLRIDFGFQDDGFGVFFQFNEAF
jgi:predicted amidohydrolase YtcJ